MSSEQNSTTAAESTVVNNNPVIVGLDIGTTKIAAIAGRKNEYGKLEILGFGRANSNGVQHATSPPIKNRYPESGATRPDDLPTLRHATAT